MATRFDDDAWTSRSRTPPFYPDAVTLVPDPVVPDLLARIDSTAGCSIKDSFASLDLTTAGFRPLFEAEWIMCDPAAPLPSPSGPPWEVVRDADAFALWEQAWRGDEGPPGLLRVDLVHHRLVTVIGAREDSRFLAGAILNHSGDVVGLSNLFAPPGRLTSTLSGCLHLARTLHPGAVLVGYESGDALDAARSHGFEPAGPLRVWFKDA